MKFNLDFETFLEFALAVSCIALFYLEIKNIRLQIENYVDKKIENMIAIFNLKNEQDKYLKELKEFAKKELKDTKKKEK